MQDETHVAILVFDNDKVVGAGAVSFYEVMPTYHNASGKKAYIMNMYTHEDYRRNGIASKTLDLLVSACKEKGVTFINLEATDMGRKLYQNYGFKSVSTEMILPIQ